LETIMTMLSNRVARVPLARRWLIPELARVLALLIMLMDSFAEAQDMARAAHKRYPFAEW
jgi:hypothetical protein